jgi:hypothetical protein
MPPRFAYWTILIDHAPTAFRAADRNDLLPTFHQLQRKNPNIALKWFARGRLWESPEQAREAALAPRVREKRGRDWRPGGQHKDPRARFDKEARRRKKREQRAGGAGGAGAGPRKPWQNRSSRPRGQRPPSDDRPWHKKRPPAPGTRRPAVPPRENEPRRRQDESAERPPKPGPVVTRPKPPERG